MKNSLRYNCPAKINLFLKLVERDSNGYHNLESLFAFLDLSDVLEVAPSDNFSLKIDGEFAIGLSLEHNLITEILDYFVQEFKVSKNLQIKLTKNIPVGAGLGGGSSDAAFFMMALNKIFLLNLSKEKLQKISFNFGSDIAFLFEDQASIIKGRGQIAAHYPMFEDISILLVNPKINLPTKDVFKKFAEQFTKQNNKFSTETNIADLQKTNVFDLLKNFPNDLTKPAESISSSITQILSELKNQQAEIAKMSGSGATCFAIFSSQNKLDEAQKNLRTIFPDYFIKQAKILSCLKR